MYILPKEADHHNFFQKYISLIEDDVMATLEQQAASFYEMIHDLQESDLEYRYAPGKWSLKESCIHLIDTEQIFAYRALCISRGEKQNLPGFDQDAYIADNSFDHITKDVLLREFASERAASISMFCTFNNNQIQRVGKASNHDLKLNSIPYIIAGHTAHHIDIIKNKYLQQ